MQFSDSMKSEQDVLAIFDAGIGYRTNNGINFCTPNGFKLTRYFLFDFNISDSPFGGIIIGRYLRIVKKCKEVVFITRDAFLKRATSFMYMGIGVCNSRMSFFSTSVL